MFRKGAECLSKRLEVGIPQPAVITGKPRFTHGICFDPAQRIGTSAQRSEITHFSFQSDFTGRITGAIQPTMPTAVVGGHLMPVVA
ncbi:MAG: hypothetical protein LBU43_10830 [Candidatus Accumulibacter sp.]|nr:hypothetical protein [Accumulibacter sp.]